MNKEQNVFTLEFDLTFLNGGANVKPQTRGGVPQNFLEYIQGNTVLKFDSFILNLIKGKKGKLEIISKIPTTDVFNIEDIEQIKVNGEIVFNDTEKLKKALDILVGQSIDRVNKLLLQATLERFGNNKTKVAKVLGITDRTIRNYRVREHGLKNKKQPKQLINEV